VTNGTELALIKARVTLWRASRLNQKVCLRAIGSLLFRSEAGENAR